MIDWDDDRLAIAGLVVTVTMAVAGAVYALSNVVTCSEQWQWTGRDYEAAYSWVSLECMMHDSKGNCSITMPVTHNEPERFVWIFRDCTGGAHRNYVSAAQHQQIPEGGHQTFSVTRWKECPCRVRRGDW